MTRHGKNCTAGAVYTYHEKRKDTAASGYGTQSVRLGKDAIKDFDCCCLSLQPCRDPVSRDSERDNGSAGSSSSSSAGASSAGPSSSSSLPSFWIPSLTPEAKPTVLKKPGKTVLCPMSGRPLKLNELVTVRFTPLDPSLDRVALLTRQDRYVCAVTKDTLGNSVPCAVLRPSGAVVTMECVERLIRKDMTDPVTGDKLTEKDIIPLQRGGTGFAGSGVGLSAKEARPVMQV
ncbi:hypothetical protein JZ751_004520 [Albula glossodonta]|uniref:Nitric oxide synthase-interacting protein n=1 Tax=Albula glossodonta TaxID=121402 RepID=A0A8T2MN87_9TELE|nr:hypothetical protein JZ751_004520 [Albula glossodonta]